MKKIELTEIEAKVLKEHIDGKFGMFTATDEQKEVMMKLIDDAEALMFELDASTDGNLMQWYWDLYNSQNE